MSTGPRPTTTGHPLVRGCERRSLRADLLPVRGRKPSLLDHMEQPDASAHSLARVAVASSATADRDREETSLCMSVRSSASTCTPVRSRREYSTGSRVR